MTFADVMSPLLCFFALMLRFSEMDGQGFKVLTGSLKDAFGVQRDHRIWDLPKGNEMIQNEFSGASLRRCFGSIPSARAP